MPWTVAVAATLTLPILWVNGLAVLLAVALLERWRSPREAISRLRWSLGSRNDPGARRGIDELTIGKQPDPAGEQERRRV